MGGSLVHVVHPTGSIMRYASHDDGAESWVDETLEAESARESERRTIPPTIPSVGPRNSFPSPIRSYMVLQPLRPIPAIVRPLAIGTSQNRQLEPAAVERRVAARSPVRRQRSSLAVVFATACIVIGVVIGGTIAFTPALDSKPAPVASHPLVVPTPIAPSPAVVAATPHVTVRLTSHPAGAQAMLLDHGKVTPIGATPVDIDLDPSHPYDVEFALAGRDRRIAHIDPAKTREVTIALEQ